MKGNKNRVSCFFVSVKKCNSLGSANVGHVPKLKPVCGCSKSVTTLLTLFASDNYHHAVQSLCAAATVLLKSMQLLTARTKSPLWYWWRIKATIMS